MLQASLHKVCKVPLFFEGRPGRVICVFVWMSGEALYWCARGKCMCQQGHGWLLLLLALCACWRIFVGPTVVVWGAPHPPKCVHGGERPLQGQDCRGSEEERGGRHW